MLGMQQLRRRGSGRVRIVATSPTVRRMLEITDLTGRFADGHEESVRPRSAAAD